MIRLITLFILFVTFFAGAASLSDSLFIEGYYSQQGKKYSRRSVENFLLALAAIGYLDEGPVDTRARDTQLGLGIGFTSFSILNAITATITRNAGIREYNASLVPLKPQAREVLGVLEI